MIIRGHFNKASSPGPRLARFMLSMFAKSQILSEIEDDDRISEQQADLNNSRTQIFDNCGRFLRKWTKTGSGNSEFRPPPLELPSVVAEIGNAEIRIFDVFRRAYYHLARGTTKRTNWPISKAILRMRIPVGFVWLILTIVAGRSAKQQATCSISYGIDDLGREKEHRRLLAGTLTLFVVEGIREVSRALDVLPRGALAVSLPIINRRLIKSTLIGKNGSLTDATFA